MVAVIHSGLDNLALALADREPHNPLKWVPPPEGLNPQGRCQELPSEN